MLRKVPFTVSLHRISIFTVCFSLLFGGAISAQLVVAQTPTPISIPKPKPAPTLTPTVTPTPTTTPEPDLVVSDVKFDSECNMQVTIENIHVIPAIGQFRFSVHPTYVLNSSMPVTSHVGPINGLPALQSVSYVRPNTMVGATTVVVTVDSLGQISETIETNNSGSFVVPPHCRALPPATPEPIRT